MAKIKTDYINTQLGQHAYELHYSAREKVFFAKGLPDYLKPFVNTAKPGYGHYGLNKLDAHSETENGVRAVLIQAVKDYEVTQDNWQLCIFYTIKKNLSNNSQPYSRGLDIEYAIAYYSEHTTA